jgi:hypothetical protein
VREGRGGRGREGIAQKKIEGIRRKTNFKFFQKRIPRMDFSSRFSENQAEEGGRRREEGGERTEESRVEEEGQRIRGRRRKEERGEGRRERGNGGEGEERAGGGRGKGEGGREGTSYGDHPNRKSRLSGISFRPQIASDRGLRYSIKGKVEGGQRIFFFLFGLFLKKALL